MLATPSSQGKPVKKNGSQYLLGACIVGSIVSPVAATQASELDAAGRQAAMSAWETTLRQQTPAMEGCFRSSFPNNGWQAVRCAQTPTAISLPPTIARNKKNDTAIAATEAAETVGKGIDYAALTLGRTRSAVGSFPHVTGVTTGVADYTLQLNTEIAENNADTCAQFGYSSCKTWQQFLYSTDSDADPSNGRTPVAYIQNWFIVENAAEFDLKGCPGGWTTYPGSDYNACVSNSYVVEVPLVPVSQIDSIQLSASATAGSVDTVIVTINGQAYSISQNAKTLNINNVWHKSEFNIFGITGDRPVISFNPGSQVTVNVAVNDGTTRAPTCLGKAGTTFEQNNLTLGKCTASGGASPSITFTQSN